MQKKKKAQAVKKHQEKKQLQKTGKASVFPSNGQDSVKKKKKSIREFGIKS